MRPRQKKWGAHGCPRAARCWHRLHARSWLPCFAPRVGCMLGAARARRLGNYQSVAPRVEVSRRSGARGEMVESVSSERGEREERGKMGGLPWAGTGLLNSMVSLRVLLLAGTWIVYVCACVCGGACVCVLQACLCCACMRVKQGLGSHVAWWCRMSQGGPTGA